MRKKIFAVTTGACLFFSSGPAFCGETSGFSTQTPIGGYGRSTTYSTTEKQYDSAVKERVERMKQGDFSAFQTPINDQIKQDTHTVNTGVGGFGGSKTWSSDPKPSSAEALKTYEKIEKTNEKFVKAAEAAINTALPEPSNPNVHYYLPVGSVKPPELPVSP